MGETVRYNRDMDRPKGYVLVVDDVPDILELVETTLQFKGYQVVTARNGQEALDLVQQNRPALIVADILMPIMDGFSLVHRLRLNPELRDIPVIFLSASYVTSEDMAFALTIGVTRFIEKPVNMETFLPIVAEYFERPPQAAPSMLNERDFYTGYQKRLEARVRQSNLQITRDQNLLDSLPEAERPVFEASLRQTIDDRDETQQLIEQISQRLTDLSSPSSTI